MNNVDFYDYRESISVKVGKFLLSKGLSLASDRGLARKEPLSGGEYSYGILYSHPDLKKIWWRKSRRKFIGVIYFKNISDKNNPLWIFEVYGIDYVKLAKQLAEEMASTFNAKIRIDFVCEKSKDELFQSDINSI